MYNPMSFRRIVEVWEAEVHLRMAVGLDPDYLPAIANLGLSHARRRDYDEAVQILRKAMAEEKAAANMEDECMAEVMKAKAALDGKEMMDDKMSTDKASN